MKQFETAAILAGGKSSRMGYDKQLLTINDKLIYQGVYESLSSMFPDIVVVTNTPNLYKSIAIRTCSDEFSNMGPLAGIHIALKNAQSEYIYLLACDMPVVNPCYIAFMKKKLEDSGAPICVAKRNGKIEPFNAFYSVKLLDDIESRLKAGNSSLFDVIMSSNPCVISEEEAAVFDSDLDMYINLNTQDEYKNYLQKVSGNELN